MATKRYQVTIFVFICLTVWCRISSKSY